MSAVVHGPKEQVDLLIQYLIQYKSLCSGDTCTPKETNDTVELTLETKYYSANVALLPVLLGSCVDDASAEGFILLPSSDERDLDSEIYCAARNAAENDVNLRLLVALSSDDSTHSAEAIKRYEEWALDNGFEFIEIGATNITEGFADREKFGLPRLMEALESNMWSTMRRRTAPLATPAPAATPAHAPAADATPKPIPQLQPPLPLPPGSDSTASTTSSVPASAEAGGGTEDSVASGAGAGERDPFELDMADSEDNEIIDKYSSFISEVKELRQLSVNGGLSDQARRDQAAAMALKLSQMFDLGSDSDSEADA